MAAVAADAPVGSSTAQLGSSLPDTGPPTQDGSAQAVAIGPSGRAPAAAADATGPSDSQNLFWLIMLAAMAIPALLVMTLVATVLIRR